MLARARGPKLADREEDTVDVDGGHAVPSRGGHLDPFALGGGWGTINDRDAAGRTVLMWAVSKTWTRSMFVADGPCQAGRTALM